MSVMEWVLIATGFLGGLTFVFLIRAAWRVLATPPSVSVNLAPGGGCIDTVVRELKAGSREILVVAHRLRSAAIKQALLGAKMRGLKVEIVLDAANEKHPDSDYGGLIKEGIVPLLDAQHPAVLLNTILIDGRTIITGSFDLTEKSEAENSADVLVVKGHPALVRAYRQYFETKRAGWEAGAGKTEKETQSPRKPEALARAG
jgi:phosphatidylserine/phosphatidylglycerophosphate/cardiolipin synthase-like enzyme